MKLCPISKPQKTEPFAIADIETRDWIHFLLIGYYDGTEFHSFRSMRKFFEFLKLHDGPTRIFAHNGGRFDFLFILKAALENQDLVEVGSIVPRGSSILFLDVSIDGKEIKFCDSSALLPFSLKSLTENFGVKTLKKDWDHTKTKTADDRQHGYSLTEYCKTDCIGLYECLEKFYQWPIIQKAGGASTIAGQAMRVFRTYLDTELWGLNEHASEFCRKAYLGGRTEIFRPMCRKGPLYEYDVSSLYPFVMSDNYFPHGRGAFTYDYEPDHLGIYEAEVRAPSRINVPCLGVVNGGRYIFPVGEFRGHFTSAEINYAMKLGYEFDFVKGYVFEEKKKLFTTFVDALWKIRSSAPKNSVDNVTTKLLLNASYGRYGMSLDKENISLDPLVEGSDEFGEPLVIDGKKIQLYTNPVRLKSFTHPAIAAFVTSYARIHMHKLYSKLGNHLYYTDTDSIFTTKPMKTGTGLGELKLEGTYDSAVFLLPKTYIATAAKKQKIAMKGFDRKKIQNFDIFDFQRALEGDLKRLKVENDPKFATFKTALAHQKLVTMTNASQKQLQSKYTKRMIFQKNGEFFTKPLTLGEFKCLSKKLKPKKQSCAKKAKTQSVRSKRSRPTLSS